MKQRMIDTDIWYDSYFSSLDDQGKLLWFNLLTNPQSMICGIFKVNLRHMASDLGWKIELVKNLLLKFKTDGKAFSIETDQDNRWIVLTNFLKRQNLNPNQKKGVMNQLKALPDYVISYINICNPYLTAVGSLEWFTEMNEGFLTLPNPSESFLTLPNPSESFRILRDNLNLNLNDNLNKSSSKDQESNKEKKDAAAALTFSEILEKYKFLLNILADFNLDKQTLYGLYKLYGARKLFLAYDKVLERGAENPAGMFISSLKWDLNANDIQEAILKKIGI